MVRFKNRYFLIELNWNNRTPPQGLTKEHLAIAVRESLRINFGEFGFNSVIQFLQSTYRLCLPATGEYFFVFSHDLTLFKFEAPQTIQITYF